MDEESGSLSPGAASPSMRTFLGVYLVGIGVGVPVFLFRLWPVVDAAGVGATKAHLPAIDLGVFDFRVTPGSAYLLLVITMGALGSYVHAATSYATFVGNRSLVGSWLWWYGLRPFVGVALALLTYFVVRGGLISEGGGTTTVAAVNPYGIAAIAGLAGMFSKQATDKLEEVFETLFRSAPGRGDAERRDKLNDLRLDGVDPPRFDLGSQALVVHLIGAGFAPAARVLVAGEARETRFVSAADLEATLLPEDVATTGSLSISVQNGAGPRSNVVSIEVTDPRSSP
jgi:hypothetical protein